MLFLEGLNHTSYFWPETCLLLSLFPVVVFPKTTETDTRLTLQQTSLDHLQWESCRRRQWQPTPVLLPGKSHGRRSLVGCSPWGHKESDMTKRLHFHFSLSCTGEGNGNPRQCSCLKNPRDGGAWWAAVYGVAQSQTRLKRLNSSNGNLVLETRRTCQYPGAHLV